MLPRTKFVYTLGKVRASRHYVSFEEALAERAKNSTTGIYRWEQRGDKISFNSAHRMAER